MAENNESFKNINKQIVSTVFEKKFQSETSVDNFSNKIKFHERTSSDFNGLCFINNNVEFANKKCKKRNGSDTEADKLEEIFKRLKYNIIKENNLNKKNLSSKIEKLKSDDLVNYDSFIGFFMSHGDENYFQCYDFGIEYEQIIDMFSDQNCPALLNKPKVLFFITSRGDKIYKGDKVEVNVIKDGKTACNTSFQNDMLIIYSTYFDYVTPRNTQNGSLFVNSLMEVLEELVKNQSMVKEIHDILEETKYKYEQKTIHWGDKDNRNPGLEFICVNHAFKKLYFSSAELRQEFQSKTLIDTFSNKTNIYEKTSSDFNGLCFINNNLEFFKKKFNKREGSDKEANKLEKIFKRLKYNVINQNNLNKKDLISIIDKLKLYDSFIGFFMSHGSKKYFECFDRRIKFERIIDMFNNQNCPVLINKPKILFFICCRGEMIDEGVETDNFKNKKTSKKVPIQSDMLIVYSTYYGYASPRSKQNGSYFGNCLIEVLEELVENPHVVKEIHDILKETSAKLIQKTSRLNWDKELIPSFEFTNRAFNKNYYLGVNS